MAPRRPSSTSRSTLSTSYSSLPTNLNTSSGTTTGQNNTGRSKTRPKTAASTFTSREQQIICAISESRGISPTVGLAFVNISTTEAVLCQLCDNQTYVKTLNKLHNFQPSEILFMSTAANPKSTLFSIIEYNLPQFPIRVIDRKYWSETTGVEYISQLAFKSDVEAIKVSIGGSYFATCCIAATLKFVEVQCQISFPLHSLRIKYEPSDGSMMIDISTVHSLELIQNLQNANSKDCLFGILNQTLTPMGSRLLRSSILQPLTDPLIILRRYDALEELTTKEEMFFATRQALKGFLDVERVLTAIVIIPMKPSAQYWEQSINNILLLKQYVKAIPQVHEALAFARSDLLVEIRELCAPTMIEDIDSLIDSTINTDISYQSQPLELRNQRTYAVKSNVYGLLDVARQTYKETTADIVQLVYDLGQTHQLNLDTAFDTARQYYIRVKEEELEGRNLPEVFINAYRKKNMIECQTLDLVKWNQKIRDSHHEVLSMSDKAIQDLTDQIRGDIAPLFNICEAIAMLDMIASFAQVVTTQDYCRPELTDTLAIKSGRHPIREKVHPDKFIPNDVYSTQQTRFQIITGCNMSGKSTYIRSIALVTVMAQIGCFVPAQYASFPINYQLFARVSMDDSIEANVSTFAAEMRETAFILRNIDRRSLVIIDELGRGTSTRDGLAIAIAVAEALVNSRASVWFATHFRDLAQIMAERNGVVNLHLAVDMVSGVSQQMTMLYRISDGCVQEKNYGLALAKVIALPSHVIEIAEKVSKELARNIERRKKGSKTVALAKRRRLILGLKEQLLQAKEGKMEGQILESWLKKLQDEFVLRMSAIDAIEDLNYSEDETIESKKGEGEADAEQSTLLSQDSTLDTSAHDCGTMVEMSGALQPQNS